MPTPLIPVLADLRKAAAAFQLALNAAPMGTQVEINGGRVLVSEMLGGDRQHYQEPFEVRVRFVPVINPVEVYP